MPPRKKKQEDISDLMRMVGESLIKQAREPDANAYVPHDKQKEFHTDEAFGRLFLGGNRSGKSVAGTVESVWWLTGTHPFIETPPPPIRGRAIGVDFTKGVEQILIPLYKRWMPAQYLEGDSWDSAYSLSERQLRLKNGSTLEFMSYEQEMDKHAGTSRHFIHFDEEPPKHIYSENMLRLLDTNGKYWITMTPLLGMTWLHEELYLPAVEGKKDKSVFSVVEVSTGDNPHLNRDAIDRIFDGIEDEAEKDARQHGKFIQIGGAVFKTFDPKVHVIPPTVPPKEWAWYMSIDSGWNNPTAVLWHAVSPENVVVTFAEHYASEMTVAEHSRVIHDMEKQWGRQADIRTGDPAMRQTKEGTGTSIQQEYALNEVFLSLDGVPTGPGSVAIGIARMQQYLRVTETPEKSITHWYITEDCVNLIAQMKSLRWATYASKKVEYNSNPQERIHKKDDHAPDSARYFFTLMPDLTPATDPMTLIAPLGAGKVERYDEALARSVKLAREQPDRLSFSGVDNFLVDEPVGTEWSIINL